MLQVVYQNNFLMFLKLARSFGYCCDVVKGKSSWFSRCSAALVLWNAPLIAHQRAVGCPECWREQQVGQAGLVWQWMSCASPLGPAPCSHV